MINQIKKLFGNNHKNSNSYGRIISKKHLLYLKSLIKNEKILYGGEFDINEKFFEPTIVEINDLGCKVMDGEIFGPILPLYTYTDFNEVDKIVEKYKNPLALYIFTNNRSFGEKFLHKHSFGGGAVNDTVVQIINDKLPFGGIGNSGMGKYHGESTFNTFSHFKPYISKPLWIDIPLRYPPFDKKLKLIKKVLNSI